MADDSAFEISHRPKRQYSRHAGLEYEGKTVFSLVPGPERTNGELEALLRRILDVDRYTYGDWFDLPMAVFLVYDHETGDVFRVAIRSGTVEFHVLPATGSAGLVALYERLCRASAGGENGSEEGTESVRWHVECRTDSD
jgi:hypothetical protein